jgi:hypothetical protein
MQVAGQFALSRPRQIRRPATKDRTRLVLLRRSWSCPLRRLTLRLVSGLSRPCQRLTRSRVRAALACYLPQPALPQATYLRLRALTGWPASCLYARYDSGTAHSRRTVRSTTCGGPVRRAMALRSTSTPWPACRAGILAGGRAEARMAARAPVIGGAGAIGEEGFWRRVGPVVCFLDCPLTRLTVPLGRDVPDSIALQAATDQDRLALDRLHIRASAMMAPRTAQDLHRERGYQMHA